MRSVCVRDMLNMRLSLVRLCIENKTSTDVAHIWTHCIYASTKLGLRVKVIKQSEVKFDGGLC